MKKLILTAVAVVASLNLYAQGTVVFQNSTSSSVINSLTGNPATSADGIRAQLYWAPLSDPNNYRPIGAIAVVGTPTAGRYIAGTRTTGPETPAGEGAWFQVKAWELSYGGSYEAASAAGPIGGRQALRGESNRFMTSATGNPNSTPPVAPVNLATAGLQGITLVVPEPSVIALGLLGAGALLLLRRRK